MISRFDIVAGGSPMRQRLARLFRAMPSAGEISGYEYPEFLDVVFRKAAAVQPGGFEWPDMAGVSSVLDFGGGCGHHYKSAVRHSPDVRWAVVETPAMAKRASEIATNRLRFFSSIDDAHDWLGDIDMMHSNSALQYTDDAIKTLRELCGLRARTMLWLRAALSARSFEYEMQSSELIDNGPGGPPAGVKNKTVKYLVTKIPEPLFLAAHRGYVLRERGKDWFRFQIEC